MKSDRRVRRSTTSSGGLTYSLLRSTETMVWVVDCFTWTSLKGLWLILSHSFRPSFIYQLTLFPILHFLFSLCLVCALGFFLKSPYTLIFFPSSPIILFIIHYIMCKISCLNLPWQEFGPPALPITLILPDCGGYFWRIRLFGGLILAKTICF